jgi:hypothetical protein
MKKSFKDSFAFDRTAFQQLSPEEANRQMEDAQGTTWQERLRYSYYLTARAYGFDPDNPPKMDRTHFEIVKRDG